MTFVAAAVLTAAQLNANLRDNLNYLKAAVDALQITPDSVLVHNNATIVIPDGVNTVVTFNTEDWDSNAIHAANDSKLICKTAGKYMIWAGGEWAASAQNWRRAMLRKTLAGGGSSSFISEDRGVAVTADAHPFDIVGFRDLAVNDWVELLVMQNSGAPLNLLASSAYSPYLGMMRLSS